MECPSVEKWARWWELLSDLQWEEMLVHLLAPQLAPLWAQKLATRLARQWVQWLDLTWEWLLGHLLGKELVHQLEDCLARKRLLVDC